MALKFQFQFAGVDFSRPSSPYRKWLRYTLTTMAVSLALLGYWQFLHHLTHRRIPPVAHAATVVPKAPVVSSVKASQSVQSVQATQSVESAKPDNTAVSSALQKVAGDSLVAVGSYLMHAAKISPPSSVANPSSYSRTVPSSVDIISGETTPRPYRVHTDHERLLMAGQTAFDNVMDMANRYPDAYGFHDGDFLSDAKLGEPMPIYTIDETDRSNYQSGQAIKPLLKSAKQWVFPVMMGDRICCMVEVRQRGHEYVPGSGNKSLALAWSKITEKWSPEDGYHPLLLVNPDIPGYYFTVPELPQQNITDIIQMFYFHPGVSPADVILASWR